MPKGELRFIKRSTGKKELAAAILGSRLARSAAARRQHSVWILAYHRVIDEPPALFHFDDEVISATTSDFRRQMAFVSRNFDVISFRDLAALEDEGRPLPPRPLIVTFDDGYRDNYLNAFPILTEFGLHATIFMATGHVGHASLFWWDLIAYCFKRTPRESAFLSEVSHFPMSLKTGPDRRAAVRLVLDWVKTAPDHEKTVFLDSLAERLDVRINAEVAAGMHLSWPEVREMASRGIEFGSHTVTHPVLSNVDDRALEREIVDSKLALESVLGDRVLAFSYPVGRSENFDSRARTMVERAGYRFAVSYEDGLAELNGTDRFALPRIHVEIYHSLRRFKAGLMFPALMLDD